MTITIHVKTDNAAFSDDPDSEQYTVVRDVLHRIRDGERAGTLHDSNGNTVGKFTVTGWKELQVSA